MSTLIPFQFDGRAVRIVCREDGQPWFVANDVCAVLDHGNPRQVLSRLDEDEKGVHNVDTPGGPQQVTVISESGLYSLILTSRKPNAKRFRKWVTAEVLPAIRKTGSYAPAEPGGWAVGEVPLPVTRLWIELVREARLLAGPAAAREIWARSPLPPLPGLPTGEAGPGSVLATFLAECIEGAPGQRVAADRVYTAYRQWAARHEHDTVTRAAFGRALGARLAKTKQGCIYYLNVRLRPPCQRPIA